LCSLFEQLKNISYYPKTNNIFNAFSINPNNIKVILLGQDPYINKNQAHGLSFYVKKNCDISPSLINIFKELTIHFI
jgi:uracil-DNA glycosylase